MSDHEATAKRIANQWWNRARKPVPTLHELVPPIVAALVAAEAEGWERASDSLEEVVDNFRAHATKLKKR